MSVYQTDRGEARDGVPGAGGAIRPRLRSQRIGWCSRFLARDRIRRRPCAPTALKLGRAYANLDQGDGFDAGGRSRPIWRGSRSRCWMQEGGEVVRHKLIARLDHQRGQLAHAPADPLCARLEPARSVSLRRSCSSSTFDPQLHSRTSGASSINFQMAAHPRGDPRAGDRSGSSAHWDALVADGRRRQRCPAMVSLVAGIGLR